MQEFVYQYSMFPNSFVIREGANPFECEYLLRNHSCLFLGDAKKVLDMLPNESVQCIVTSPPYWSLRDYHIEGQIGLEESVYDYIKVLADIFDQAKRVLKKDGTFWLNLGDSYTSGGRKWRAPDGKNKARAMETRPDTPAGLKSKELIGIPWRLAFALQERGWYLRSDIIWEKPNCQPESVKDRPTKSHEYLFLLSKSENYKYDVNAMKGPNGRRIRDVWSINTKSDKYTNGHYAIYPTDLVNPCILFGTDEDDIVLDPFMGSGTTAIVANRLNRRFVGIELNPDYYRISIERLCSDGMTIEEVNV